MNELLSPREDERAQDLQQGHELEGPATTQEQGPATDRRESPHRPADAKGQVSAQAASDFGHSMADNAVAGDEEETRATGHDGEMDGGVDAEDGSDDGPEDELEEEEEVEEAEEEDLDEDTDSEPEDGDAGDDADGADEADDAGEAPPPADTGSAGEGDAGAPSGGGPPDGGKPVVFQAKVAEVSATGGVVADPVTGPGPQTGGGGGPTATAPTGGGTGSRGGRASGGGGPAKAPKAGALDGGSEEVEEQLSGASATEFALQVGQAGGALTDALRGETADIAESVPDFHATMPGEDGGIAAQGASVIDPHSETALDDEMAGEEAVVPDPATVDAQQVLVDNPGEGVPKTLPADTAADQVRRIVDQVLALFTPSAEAVSTEVGAPPQASLSGEADPARAANQEAEANSNLDLALSDHGGSLDQAPGEELVQRQTLDEVFESGPLVSEAVPDVVAGPDAQWYGGIPIDPAVRTKADEILGAQGLEDDQAQMHAEMDSAIEERDAMRASALADGQTSVDEMNSDARTVQEEAVADARQEIAAKRKDIHVQQGQAVADAKRKSDRAARDVEGEIDARQSTDQARIESEYQAAQQKADAEKARAEANAAEEKRKAEEESEDDGWFSSIGNAVGGFFEGLADLVGGIFDALSEFVSGVINAVVELASSIIDGLCEFACGLLDGLATLVKGFVTAVVGQFFPELARDFCALVDTATAAAKDGIRSAADSLKAGVKAAAETVNSTIQAGIRVARAGVTTGLRVAGKVAQGDFEGAAFALLEGALDMAGISHEAFYGFIGKSLDTISAIVDDPGSFIGHLVDSVGLGFDQFQGNFVDHLLGGVVGWLTGQLGDAGLQLPKTWDAAGIFELVLSVIGVSEDRVFGKVEKKIGKENRELIEGVWGYVKVLISGGLGGLWDTISGQIGNLWDMLIDGVKGFLMEKIVTAAVTKIVSMFNPVGAIVQALIMAWDVYKFVKEKASQIFTMVSGIANSITNIVQGQIGDAANAVEESMARAIPLAISFLASLLGLDGISKKVKEVIEGFREKVDKGLDWLIDNGLDKVRALVDGAKKLLKGGKDETQAGGGAGAPAPGQQLPGAEPTPAPGTKPDPKKLPEGPMITTSGALTLRIAVAEGSEVGIVRAEGAWNGALGSTVLPLLEKAALGKPESPSRAVALDHHQLAMLSLISVQGKVHDYLVGKPNLSEIEGSMKTLVEHTLLLANFAGKATEGQATAPPGQAAMGEAVTFQAGAESHRLWIDPSGAQPVPMVASTPMTVKDRIAGWKPQLDAMSKEDKKRAGSTIGRGIAIEREITRIAAAIQGGTGQAADLTTKQSELVGVLAELFVMFDDKAGAESIGLDPAATFSGDQWKTFQARFAAMGQSIGMANPGKEAEAIWLLVCNKLVAAADQWKGLPDDGKYKKLEGAVFDSILEDLDPIAAALGPAMDKLTGGKTIWAFWSGQGALSAASDSANAEVALEASALGQLFNELSIVPAVKNMPLWSALSRAYATFAGQRFSQRTFRGFLSQKPREQSIIKKVEQPRFKVLAEEAKATPQVSYHAVAQDVTNPDRHDTAVSAGSLRGVFRSGSDMDAEGEFAAQENARRMAAAKAAAGVTPTPPQPTPPSGTDPAQGNHAQVPGNAVAGVGQGAVPAVGAGGHPNPGQVGNAAVAPADPKGKLPNQVVPVEGVLGQKSGGPGAPAGQAHGIGEGQQGGQVAHGATPAEEAKPVKADPALLPALPWKDAQGEDHTIAVERVGGKAEVVKHSKPTVITNAYEVAQKIKADTDRWLTLDANSPESRELLASIRADMARLLQVMAENRAPTDLAKKRQAFEEKLGARAMRHDAALGASQELCDKIWTVLQGLAQETRAREQSADARLIELAQECGKKLDSGFAGAIGQEYGKIEAVLKGGGNLRERCLLAYNFQDVLGATVPGVTIDKLGQIFSRVQDKAREVDLLKERAGLTKPGDKKNTKALFGTMSEEGNDALNQGQQEFAQAKKPDQVTGKEMDDKLPAIPLAALPEADLRALARAQGLSGWDKKDVATLASELAAKRNDKTSGRGEGNVLSRSSRTRVGPDVGLSADEGAAVSFRGEEFLPFIEGEVANLVDERNAWIRRARELQMPIKAGISGTAHRFMNFAKTMGASSMPSVRLAMLGYLLPMNAHSFHEIMTASRGHAGCDYVAGHYLPLEPMGESELQPLAGTQADWDAIKSPPGLATS